ncbi:hypothetical protein [Oceanobacillus sp. FSL H7-0719]|uniref:hypothetical protein n=1 Tax=Oceanobacillus sp. FSL H7-0719 TaxID=2954507 RepID=UPI0032504608
MKEKKREKHDHVAPQAEMGCYKHTDCCYEKGCPGLWKVINNELIYTGKCC